MVLGLRFLKSIGDPLKSFHLVGYIYLSIFIILEIRSINLKTTTISYYVNLKKTFFNPPPQKKNKTNPTNFSEKNGTFFTFLQNSLVLDFIEVNRILTCTYAVSHVVKEEHYMKNIWPHTEMSLEKGGIY